MIDYKDLWVKAVKVFSKSKRTQWNKANIVEKMKDLELEEARKIPSVDPNSQAAT